jgi:germination protein M
VPAQQPAATSTPPPAVSNAVVWLYFADATGSLYVPVQRAVKVEDKKIAEAAIRALIEGPRGDLQRLVVGSVKLLGVSIRANTATVNFDSPPNGSGDERGLWAVVLTLTHFPNVERVQIQVNGQPYGLNDGQPVSRPVVNPLNPQGLPFDYRSTEFLPTYYLTADGDHSVRIMRMVPKTRETASSTIRALLDGPGDYGYAVQEVIPDGTTLRAISISEGIATVDLSSPFAEAGNRDAAVRTIVESLTTLGPVTGVRILVDGQSLGGVWGEPYGRVFPRPLINAE